MTLLVQPDFKFTAQDVEKFLAFMGVRFAAAAARFDAEEVRFHGGVAQGEEFHADRGAGFEDFALGGADERLSFAVGFKHGKNVGFVEACDALESGDRGAHLAALEGAEESDGNPGGTRDLREREAAFDAQAAEFLTGGVTGVRGSRDNALFFQNVYNRGRIEAARAAKKDGALEEADIGLVVEAIAAGSAVR